MFHDRSFSWCPDAICDGQPADVRMLELVEKQGLTEQEAREHIIAAYPAEFAKAGSGDQEARVAECPAEAGPNASSSGEPYDTDHVAASSKNLVLHEKATEAVYDAAVVDFPAAAALSSVSSVAAPESVPGEAVHQAVVEEFLVTAASSEETAPDDRLGQSVQETVATIFSLAAASSGETAVGDIVAEAVQEACPLDCSSTLGSFTAVAEAVPSAKANGSKSADPMTDSVEHLSPQSSLAKVDCSPSMGSCNEFAATPLHPNVSDGVADFTEDKSPLMVQEQSGVPKAYSTDVLTLAASCSATDVELELASTDLSHETLETSHLSVLFNSMAGTELDRGKECAICFGLALHPLELPCSHCYCQDCLLKSIAHFGHTRCPMCHGELFPGQDSMQEGCLPTFNERTDSSQPSSVVAAVAHDMQSHCSVAHPQQSGIGLDSLGQSESVTFAGRENCRLCVGSSLDSEGELPSIPRGLSGLSASWRVRPVRRRSEDYNMESERTRQSSNFMVEVMNRSAKSTKQSNCLARWCGLSIFCCEGKKAPSREQIISRKGTQELDSGDNQFRSPVQQTAFLIQDS